MTEAEMDFPERFSNLPDYAFPRLRALLDRHTPGGEVSHMSIGEPKHAFPDWVGDILTASLADFRRYPPNDGTAELLASISGWIKRRFDASIDPETQLMALNGSREGLYYSLQALCPERKNGRQPKVLMPNPFYQVYAIAALSAGAEPIYVNAEEANGFLPDFSSLPQKTLDDTAAVYVCSPSNPQGAVADRAYWKELLTLAEVHDFRIFADECYSEVYCDQPPVGILTVADEVGANPERVLSFHSLSKRSNMAGLRSGFVATGPKNTVALKRLRAYAGAPLPLPLQHVSQKLWDDDEHVAVSRSLYREKFDLAEETFAGVNSYRTPEGGFFLWLPVENDEEAVLKLWKTNGIRTLPGSYLARDTAAGNPGKSYIRVALVAEKEEVARGLSSIRSTLYN
jgi:N-succinyldiaminopimelate aminotransferase